MKINQTQKIYLLLGGLGVVLAARFLLDKQNPIDDILIPPPTPDEGGGGGGGGTPIPVSGLAGVSYLADPSYPRGMRNNNPGNIKKSSNAWVGKLASTDAEFEQFRTYVYGVRAMIKLVSNYINNGHNSLQKIVARWAPEAAGNRTSSYINYVSFPPGYQYLNPVSVLRADKATLKRLVLPMADYENGRTGTISSEMFDLAYSML